MQPDAPYQPQPQPQPTPPTETTYQQPTQTAHNPGKTLGIVGFIFAFVGLHIIGLILSIVGLSKSKRAGMKNGLAVAGIILNSVFMVLTVLLIAITVIAYSGISARANTTEARYTAQSVIAEVSNYRTEHNGIFPTTYSDLSSSIATFSPTPLLGEPASPETVALWSCTDKGNAVEYWDYTQSKAVLIFTEDYLTINDCSFVEE